MKFKTYLINAGDTSWRKNDKRLLFYFTTTSIRHLPCYIIYRKNQTKINIIKYIGVGYGRSGG